MTVTMTEPGALPAQPRCRTDILELGAYDSAVPSARLHARAVLREWHLDPVLDAAESVVAEIVADAVQAPRDAGLDTGIRLTLTASGEGVLVVVCGTRSRFRPPPSARTPTASMDVAS